HSDCNDAVGAIFSVLSAESVKTLRIIEVIVTIMFNYIVLYSANSIIRNVLTDSADKTEKIAPTASLQSEWLQGLTDYSRMHYGIVLALLAVFVLWFIMEKTTIGYEIRSVGYNRHASEYAGMKVSKNIILGMVISGAFAGLAGSMEGLGTFGNMSIQSGFTNLGFDGIAVALLGANRALGVVFAAILFGALKVG